MIQYFEICGNFFSIRFTKGINRLKLFDNWKMGEYIKAMQKNRGKLRTGLIEQTIPDKPRSSKQAYRLTEAGFRFVGTRLD
jgi:hypothetical protein